MSEEREFEGEDLETALAAAESALGIPADELHYEMIEQGRRGLLGMGVRAVRIRVMPPLEGELPARTPQDEPVRQPAPPPRTSQPEARPVAATDVQGVEQTVRRMVELMGLELDIDVKARDGAVELRLEGPDQKMLMAGNAELLISIQFLLNRMGRRAWPGAGRIHLACDGHTRPRDEELVAVARKVAEQVASTGKTRKLQPMNAYERRLVHLAVREFAGLTSSSDGKGALKRVRISKVQNQY